ncbi:guanine nucleotide-binding protein [Multifurca ochricompacta]|uniref:Guanine nucleotide-binding protein n=1 Tax=Multifurca ochricompacta TaxID=376703 RepID=A0AAD4QPU1_9AGAM|nr:guanine nucleotide-binding protein [Multifurca ochricompacta]
MLHARRPPSVYSQEDPLSFATRPPEAETDLERRVRLQREADAKRISDIIDEELKIDKRNYERSKQDVRLLLLGQAESGKSTLQKQFQLMYSPDSLDQERSSWRTVVYFNIARSVKRILEVLESHGDMFDEDASDRIENPYDSTTSKRTLEERIHQDIIEDSPPQAPRPYPSPLVTETQKLIATLRLRLSPLVAAESTLADRLSGGVRVSGSGKGGVYVRHGWQTRSVPRNTPSTALRTRGSSVTNHALPSPITDGGININIAEVVEEVGRILDASKEDVKALWRSDVVQMMIKRRRLRLEEWAEFFIGDIDRVAARDYVPSTDDILHARIQTMGVSEHLFEVPLHGKSVTWHLYDVGGARGQRHSWVPYFDEANAIIFVAPISAFDQYLEEDPRTNRIDDSLQLFTAICSNQLLKNIHLVLFLNKTDVLQNKLASGVRVSKYITSYGNRPNDYESVVNYFRAHFLQVHRKNNEKKRVLYSHLTNVVDIKTTRSIIANVRDSIFRDYLKSAALV